MSFPSSHSTCPLLPQELATRSPAASGSSASTAPAQEAGAMPDIPRQGLDQKLASLHGQLIESGARVPTGTPSWRPGNSEDRRLYQTEDGFAYRNESEHIRGEGGLFFPKDRSRPVRCHDWSQAADWARALEYRLTLALPTSPTIFSICRQLETTLRRNRTDLEACEEALNQALATVRALEGSRHLFLSRIKSAVVIPAPINLPPEVEAHLKRIVDRELDELG
ncbi:hypothetical protein GT347_22755 [Xylophilus rhododendri]|uniref:Uncharacterized protein n=1 Tax=Xylophilus rhododendri TaxID=2697032 RepID=A0A857J9Z0_9BURK|nr:hypothetical protein [Xylophilus rhododendri]QHJ00548.1 hypothetical protein GT347_22755 [Xylophilus rhododendri]